MIRQINKHKFRLYSHKKDKKTGRHKILGTFTTRQGAMTREKQVQAFKHMGESVDEFGFPEEEEKK